MVDGVYRLRARGLKAWLEQVRGAVMPRAQGERTPGPLCPDTLANTMVPCHVPDLEALVTGAIRTLATAGVVGKRVTGIADGADLETSARARGGGHATRTRRTEETCGRGHEIEVTVSGWNVRLVIEAVTRIPLAVKVVQMQGHGALAGAARLSKVVCDKGFWAGTDRWWLAQQGIRWVVPATDHRAVAADARARAAAGEGGSVGCRVHTVRQGQGHAAWSAWWEPEVVGIPGLTTDAP